MHWGEYTDHRDRDLPSRTAHANCGDTGLTGRAVRDPVRCRERRLAGERPSDLGHRIKLPSVFVQ